MTSQLPTSHAGTGASKPQKMKTTATPQQAIEPKTHEPTALSAKVPPKMIWTSSALPPLSKTMDWTIKVLGLAAALVFGIWAPLSFEATEASGDDTNEKFESLTNQLSAWKTSAASMQASAASDLSSMSRKMDLAATLSVYDFCQGRSSIAACASVTRSLDVNALVSAIIPTATATSSWSPSASTTSSSRPTTSSQANSNGKGGAKLPLPAILGIVFGIVVFAGLLIGFVAWKRREKRRKIEQSEAYS